MAEADMLRTALRICSGAEKCKACPMQSEDECIHMVMGQAYRYIQALEAERAQLREALQNWHEGHDNDAGDAVGRATG